MIYINYYLDPRVISDSQFEKSVDELRRQVVNASGSLKEERFLTVLNDFREGTSQKDSRVNRVKHFYYAEMFENTVVNDDEELLILTYFSYQNPTEYMETIKTDPDLGNHGTLENFLESFNENLGDLEVIDEDTIELGYDYTAGYEIITLTRQ